MIRIGLLSNDRTLQPLLSSALGRDFQVHSVYEAETDDLWARNCDVMLLDMESDQSGLDARLAFFRELVSAGAVAVAMADDALRSEAVELVRLGAFGYCRRPPSIRDLKALIQRAYESAVLKRSAPKLAQKRDVATDCDGLIGSSHLMQQVYDLVHKVASIRVSVLITGQSGTGKELIARAIHRLGGRPDRPFVAVSCGAIPETLIESELFGHEKGAFTGSTGSRVGLLEEAGDGTLFLDEIGELSLSTQVKLLRVLQQREFTRLGSNRPIRLSARLVFATHQNLADMVEQGKWRQDLYYRINVMRIESPALQDHPEDIDAIARHFLAHYSELYEKQMTDIEPECLALLRNYSWPGNVRELENVIQHAIVVAHGDTLRAQDLPVALRAQNVISIDEFNPCGSFALQMRNYKVKLAMTAVQDNHGNKSEAARSLQISRAYLHRLLRLAEPGVMDDMACDMDSTALRIA